jgi:hypothetical protein
LRGNERVRDAAAACFETPRRNLMPTISWFYGIAIRMHFLDHPPPHFQAVYGEHEANIAIATGEVVEGHLPRTAARLVKQ